MRLTVDASIVVKWFVAELMSDEARIDLLALGWFGAGLFRSWRKSIEHAEKVIVRFDPHYAAGYGRHWRAGYNRVIGG